jgi:hypothetical protein
MKVASLIGMSGKSGPDVMKKVDVWDPYGAFDENMSPEKFVQYVKGKIKDSSPTVFKDGMERMRT